MYKNLGSDGKMNFLRQFERNKGKDLNWVYEFSEVVQKSQSTEMKMKEGYFNMYQIMHMNGMGFLDMDAPKSQELFQGLLTEAEAKFEYKIEIEESTIPNLSRYFYKFCEGVTTKHVQSTTESMKISQTMKKEQISFLTSSSGSSDVVIKAEQPIMVEIKSTIRNLKSAKPVLEKLHLQSQDVLTSLDMKGKKEVGIQSAAEEFKQFMDSFSKFLSDLRISIIEGEQIMGDEDGLDEKLKKYQHMVAMASAHQDGMKDKLKRYRVLI